jgi:hypothetical protein
LRVADVKLNILQRAWLRLFGCVRVGAKAFERGSLGLYAVRCGRHGVFLDYPHGWDGYFLCEKCWVERRELVKQK